MSEYEQLDLFNLDGFDLSGLSATTRRVLHAHEDIRGGETDRIEYLHPVLCQVGMPRNPTEKRSFFRECGNASILVEAGHLRIGGKWVEQPMPSGAKPRIILGFLCGEAIRNQSPVVKLGRSMSEFLGWLGLSDSGGVRGDATAFKKQLYALAACHMTLSRNAGDTDRTSKTVGPIEHFEAWKSPREGGCWLKELELSQQFYQTLRDSPVPLDPRALVALSHSSLALDIYAFLAYRLWRVNRPSGVKLSWENLRDQFGQEYSNPKDFKKTFRIALLSALTAYPEAKVEDVPGGLLLRKSPSPISPKIRRSRPLRAVREK